MLNMMARKAPGKPVRLDFSTSTRRVSLAASLPQDKMIEIKRSNNVFQNPDDNKLKDQDSHLYISLV
jgi:hypothetical protein